MPTYLKIAFHFSNKDASEHSFELPVTYKGQELSFSAWLLMIGYTHKIQVEVNGQLVKFEPDEEQNYRAVLDAAQLEKSNKLDIPILKAIAEVIELAVK